DTALAHLQCRGEVARVDGDATGQYPIHIVEAPVDLCQLRQGHCKLTVAAELAIANGRIEGRLSQSVIGHAQTFQGAPRSTVIHGEANIALADAKTGNRCLNISSRDADIS